MTQAGLSPRERYAQLVETFVGNPDVTPPDDAGSSRKTFGSSTLRVKGKIFAMLSDDALIVKLPKQRVDVLIEASEGDRFNGGKGQPMKEWLRVRPGAEDRWLTLAQEALEFVESKG